MIFAKIFLSILVVILSFVLYLYGLKMFFNFNFSLAIGGIILGAFVVFFTLLLVLVLYLRRLKEYDVSRLDSDEVKKISKFISVVPIFFSMVSLLFVFAVAAYEYRISKSLVKFFNVVIFSLPISFLTYYLIKMSLYEIRFKGFSYFKRGVFGIFGNFTLLLVLYVIISLIVLFLSSFYFRTSKPLVIFLLISSFVLSISLFVWDLVLRIKYIITILKAPEFFDKFIPVFSNDEIGIISTYLDSFVQRKGNTRDFPEVYIGNTKIRVDLGKQFCGTVWIRLFDINNAFLEFSEKVIDDVQLAFSKIESKVIENRGFVAKFDGIEMIVIFGLDGSDWVDNLKSFIFELGSMYRNNVLDNISTFKVGVSAGRVFVGFVESINGNLPYFFGEAILESYIVGRYPKGEGIFVSGDLKEMFGVSEFVDKVRIREITKIVEIYRLFI